MPKLARSAGGLWVSSKTQLALSGVGGNCEGMLLTACHFGEQGKTNSMKFKWLVAMGDRHE